MPSSCARALWRAGRLASHARSAGALQDRASLATGLTKLAVEGDSLTHVGAKNHSSLLPACAQASIGQQRWAQTKADKKAAAKAAAEGAQAGNLNAKMQTLLQALEPVEIPPSQLSKEDLAEHKRIAKQYSRMKMKEHRHWQKRMATKIQLQQAAIEALPAELQDHARTPDYEDFPSDRWIPTHTAPIDGYMESQGSEDRSKRRR